MEIREGYKQTEIGVIPEDWDYLKAEDCVSIKTGSRNTVDKQNDGVYPFFVRSQQVEKINSFSFDCEAVLTAGDGVGTGKVFHYINGKFDVHQRVYVMNDFKNILGKYFYYYFSNYFYDEVCKYTAKSSVDSVRRDMVAKMLLPIPPIPEQQAIATALSDIDGLINSLQKLIDKKKKIKQGTMQELLTGKRRLEGFRGEWEERYLGDITEIISGGTPKTSISEYWNGEIKWCTPTDITGCKTKYLYETEKSITHSGLKNSSATLLPKGALLFCSRATIGEVRIAYDSICTNQGFKSLVVYPGINNEWLYYWVIANKAIFLEKAIGSTFLEISKKDIQVVSIKVPTLPEQTAIANILSDMDSEIEALERKLNKYKDIKQGMMQELLTGRIRLLEEAVP